MDEIDEYRRDLLNQIATNQNQHSEFAFFQIVSEMLEDAGDFDNIEEKYINIESRGIRANGYCWNEIDRTLNVFLVNFSGDDETSTISRSEITSLAQKPDDCLKICITIRCSTAFHL